MEIYSRGRARRALFHTVAFRTVSQVATALSFVVLVRGLSEQSLGIYSLLYAIIPVIGTVLSLGLDQVLRRFQPEYLRAGNAAAAAWLVRVVARARLGTNLLLLLALFAAWNIVAPWFNLAEHRSDFQVFSVILLFYFQTIILQSSLASHMLQSYSVGSVALLSVSKLIAYLAVYQFFEFTLRAAIVADIVSYVIGYAFLAYVHWRNCSPIRAEAAWRPDVAEKKRLGKYAIANNFNESSSVLLHVQTDNFFIASMMNAAAVGAYAFYARINEMIGNLIPTRLFDNIIQPMFFATPPEHAAERLPRLVTFLINISMMVQWPLFAYTLAYHRELIGIAFDGKFLEHSLLLPLVVGFAVTNNCISTPVTMTALYAERASLILKSQLFGIYQIAAMLTMIPLWGLYGAAIATGTLHLFRNLWVWWHVRATARWLNVGAALGAGALIWSVALGICFAIKSIEGLPALVSLVAGAFVCGTAFLVYVRSPAISVSDRDILAGVLHGKESGLLRWVGLAPRVV